MTDPAHGAHGHGAVRSEDDRISTGKILLVGIASLVLFFFASMAVVLYMSFRQGERPPLPIPPEMGASKIGMVEQQLFDLSFRGARDRASRIERLDSYGWVDRPAGIVHMPIDRAMGLVVEGVRAAPGGPPEPPRVPGGQP
jgi:hypothetical protein